MSKWTMNECRDSTDIIVDGVRGDVIVNDLHRKVYVEFAMKKYVVTVHRAIPKHLCGDSVRRTRRGRATDWAHEVVQELTHGVVPE